MAVDDAGFGAGACAMFVGPWWGSDGADVELDDVCEDGDSKFPDSSWYPKLSKYPSHSFSNSSSSPASPTQLSRLQVCALHRHMLDVSLALIQEPGGRSR